MGKFLIEKKKLVNYGGIVREVNYGQRGYKNSVASAVEIEVDSRAIVEASIC